MSIPMIALKPMIYAGKRYSAGQEFTARGQNDARILIAIGHADFAPAESPDAVPMPTQQRAHLVPAVAAAPAYEPPPAPEPAPVAEPEPEPVAAADDAGPETLPPAADVAAAAPEPAAEPDAEPAAKPRRTYRRRDLTAQS